ncbi:peptidoglycan DD-metalloendopeptidase family protein [Flavobacterium sp.]|uniref:M23 family metallopeptidase n=1 Tax=Flavobacterium sp. TaxID=239 RepID=UPI0012298244|nr:peptidoglycan DD-metalloendopeptidase family protein [Flavobacterium sp.]RZJ72438.1 MAG: M23 family peptidase [Flavobacterium sp.]
MKRLQLLILPVFLLLFACGKSDEEKTVKKPVAEKKIEIVEFGFKLNDFDVLNDTIVSGDTFGSILEEQNFNPTQIHDIVEQVRDTFDVRKIRVGKPYTILRTKDASKKAQIFIYQPDRLSYYVVDLRDSIAKSYKKVRPIKIRRRTIAAALDGSLTEELERQKVDPALANQISTVYAWSIDFFKLQKGDKFAITFTERFINDTIYDGVEEMEAAFFEYKGKLIYAFPFVQDTTRGKVAYFDEEGKVLKNFFLKAPLKFSRISSRFSRNRFHPVQQVWKAHKGTDYAAPTGTPIMTTASGVVEQTGYTTGNGNFVKVKHNGTYSTQYLHMSKILVRRGQRVTQGDVIGRVGSTGLATGPHVCYRFWRNGVQVDPLGLRLPNAEPMDKRYKDRFIAEMTPLKRELDSVAEKKFGSLTKG